jgi:hypothetical protein
LRTVGCLDLDIGLQLSSSDPQLQSLAGSSERANLVRRTWERRKGLRKEQEKGEIMKK